MVNIKSISAKLNICIYFLISFLILFLLLFYNNYNYAKKLEVTIYNKYLLLLGLLTLILIIIFYKIIKNYLTKINLIFTFIILILIQILIIYSYYFVTGWDVKFIIENSLNVYENHILKDPYYFSVYPNNIFMVKIYFEIISLINLVGLGKYSYFILIVLMILICNFTGLLLYKVIIKLFNNDYIAIIGYVYYILLIYISPWISIPYSDTLTLFFPIMALYIYIYLENIVLKWLLLISTLVISINIKPQSAIIIIAIFIYEFIYGNNYIKTVVVKLTTIIVSFIILSMTINNLTFDLTKELNPEFETSYVHFIKLGLNEETSGQWNKEDIEYSQSILIKEDRDKANWNIIKYRINNLLEKDKLLEHFIKKTLLNYNDGTFYWSKEGTFYKGIIERNNIISKLTRNIYYEDGKLYNYFNGLQQSNWLVILFLGLVGAFKFKKLEDNNYRFIIYATLIGLFIFETIFEARSRYLITNVPIFIISAMYGLQNLIEIKNKILLK